jgi:hypothetical protein
MSKLDPWEGARTYPEDVISPGDHDALVFNDVAYMITLRRARSSIDTMLQKLSQSPGFSGDINGSFSWHAPGWGPD